MIIFFKIILLGLIGAFIGYITNMVAIKLLFRPVEEKKVLFLKFQGLLPKRRSEIANNIGEVVDKELLNSDVLIEKIGLNGMMATMIKSYLEKKVDFKEIVEEKINEMDVLEIERIIIGLAKKELRHIEIMGGVLGFMIGILQALIVIFI